MKLMNVYLYMYMWYLFDLWLIVGFTENSASDVSSTKWMNFISLCQTKFNVYVIKQGLFNDLRSSPITCI